MSSKGRKRKAGPRTASGRLSRAASAYQENAEPIAVRMRMFGLSEADARDQKASTFIGRLSMAEKQERGQGITEAQYEAAMEYLAAYEAFQRAVKSPDALRTGSGGGDQGESPRYEWWCRQAIDRFEGIKKAVQAEQCLHQNRGANMFAALDYLVCRNEHHGHMVGDLRLALNAVGHHMGIIHKPKRRAVDKSVEEPA